MNHPTIKFILQFWKHFTKKEKHETNFNYITFEVFIFFHQQIQFNMVVFIKNSLLWNTDFFLSKRQCIGVYYTQGKTFLYLST